MDFDVVVIGAGPAGIFAAGRSAQKGAKTALIDKNPALGKKLLITGKGRCNLTNSGEIQDFISSYNNGKFLYQAFGRFFNEDLVNFFENRGLKTKVERGGRIFPVSDESRDVVAVLSGYLKETGVMLLLGEGAARVLVENGPGGGARACGVKLVNSDKAVMASKVIIATGGQSYPGTGSTGDGYGMAKTLGHEVTPLYPALVPLETKEKFVKEVSGLSLKNVEVTVFADGKKTVSDFGEMLFTHFGVSGPLILSFSGDIARRLAGKQSVVISINFKPALDKEKLTARLLRELDSSGLKTVPNIMKTLLPQSLIPVFLKLSGIAPEKKGNQVTRAEREAVYRLLTDFRLEISAARKFDEAIVTKGGVSLKEISPNTMESKIISGLYFCGEVLDIDGLTGGYNLQAAFSTGYLAGDSAGSK
jgi:predicted Rossmann fold flavoprotein